MPRGFLMPGNGRRPHDLHRSNAQWLAHQSEPSRQISRPPTPVSLGARRDHAGSGSDAVNALCALVDLPVWLTTALVPGVGLLVSLSLAVLIVQKLNRLWDECRGLQRRLTKRRSRGRKRSGGRHTKKHRADRRRADSAATRACSGRPTPARSAVYVRGRPPGAAGSPR